MSEGYLIKCVESCNTLDDLIALMDRSVAPNGKPYKLAGYGTIVDSHFVRDRIVEFQNGCCSIISITRNYGLRDKVAQISAVKNDIICN